MSQELLCTFNENDATNVFDYSGNGRKATTITGFSVAASDLGFAGVFNGSTTDLDFGNILDFGGTALLTIHCEIKRSGSSAHVICDKSAHFTLEINASDKVVFTVDAGAVPTSITSATSITNDTLTNIVAVYDGSDMYIYLDGTQDQTGSKTGNMNASSNTFNIGTDGSNFLTGEIEVLDVWNNNTTATEVTSLNGSPTGIEYETHTAHNLATGDLITDDPYAGSPANMVVTFNSSSTVFYARPVAGIKINFGRNPIRRGNIGLDTTRQTIFETVIVSNEPILKVYCDVDSFTLPSPTIQIDCNGIVNTGGVTKAYIAKTANYTATATDYFIDCTANTFTIKLPTAVGITGREYVIKNSGAGTITIDGDGAETIDGAATVSLSVQYGFSRVMSDGANWKTS